MSNPDASERFDTAVQAFRRLEKELRENIGKVNPKKIDEVLLDLEAAIPGLTEEELGRGLLFRVYVLQWREQVNSSKKNVFEVINSPTDPRLNEALESARQGHQYLRSKSDLEWAEGLISQLEEYFKNPE